MSCAYRVSPWQMRSAPRSVHPVDDQGTWGVPEPGVANGVGEDKARRRADELSFVKQHDTKNPDSWFLIDAAWVQKWIAFVQGKGQEPGPIDNTSLMQPDAGSSLKPSKDYRGVNRKVWQYWQERYEGGPTIERPELDLNSHAPAAPPPSVDQPAPPHDSPPALPIAPAEPLKAAEAAIRASLQPAVPRGKSVTVLSPASTREADLSSFSGIGGRLDDSTDPQGIMDKLRCQHEALHAFLKGWMRDQSELLELTSQTMQMKLPTTPGPIAL
eukprot:4394991-Amphidinium_carterae.1